MEAVGLHRPDDRTPMSSLSIGFFGLPLAALLLHGDGHRVAWSVLSPVDAPGRRRLRAALCTDRVIDLLQDDSGFVRRVDMLFDACPVDLVVSWYFTRRIEARWIERPRLRAIGVHPSLLPRHRGPNPFFAAIDSGDLETGVSAHLLERDYDTGKVLGQSRLLVGAMNAWQLARALDRPSLQVLREVVGDFAKGRFRAATPQSEDEATWAPEPTHEMLRVDWNWPTERILRRIRALSPVPGLALELNGQRFFVTVATEAWDFPRVLRPGDAHLGVRLILRTGDGAIAVERAQLADALEPDAPDQPDVADAGEVLSGEALVGLLRARER
jgi:methionyl-tRNA formyltransferase